MFALILRTLLRKRDQRELNASDCAEHHHPKRLLSIWQQFLAPLPPSVRVALPDYDHFIVLGDPGVGKSALITRRVDWQGQASQFLPSYTPDPLMQVYLGSRLVVQEISATLLQFTTRDVHEAFRRMWRASLPRGVPPLVVVVLKASVLSTASPDVIRQQAQLIRGKLNLLSELYGVPIQTRICLTHMERVRGYVEFARFLNKGRVPLVLDISGDAEGHGRRPQSGYEKHVPRALTSLPVARFEASVALLSSAETVLGPVRAFIAALVEGSVASARPDVKQVYFSRWPLMNRSAIPSTPRDLAGRRWRRRCHGSSAGWRRWESRRCMRPEPAHPAGRCVAAVAHAASSQRARSPRRPLPWRRSRARYGGHKSR